MKFTGHERDPETGLDYMLARYYTAGSGRFLQVDPGYDYKMGDPMSWNLYSYVRENPVMGTDPNGTNWFKIKGEWTWKPGATYTYKDKNGKEQTLKSSYKYLGRFVILSVRNGRAVGYISFQTGNNETGKVFEAWKTKKVIFSGSSLTGPIKDGLYYLNLSKIVDSREGTTLNAKHNPIWKGGYLEYLPRTGTDDNGTWNIFDPWGTWRINLRASAEVVKRYGGDIKEANGNYIHGRGDKEHRRWTLGCIADPTDDVLYELLIIRRTTSSVPFVVAGGSQ